MDSKYEDILSARRQEISNWLWVTRAISPVSAVEFKNKPTPESHKKRVLESPKIKELIQEISIKQNVPEAEVIKQIKLILEEIGYKKNLQVIRCLGFVLTKICLKVLLGIYVNHDGILKLKSKMGKCPVIFVPSHRSYADFIIFSLVCFHYDIQIPAIAAGMDFHGMMGLGEMLRNTGAFFMRRAYNDDSLYWATFKEYVYQLVSKGHLPMEFFIEGTRSRSNKSLTPKYGLINMILKAFFLYQVPDILFVPVSINYDRILEESLFAFELLGIPKPKESTSGFFKSLKILKENFGNIYMHFGEPISARSFLLTEDTAHNLGPINLHEVNNEEKRLIPPLAYEIIRRQQLASPVGYFNLFALILNNNLTRGRQFCTKDELENEIRILKQSLQSWGAVIFDRSIAEAIEECLVVHSNLICCQEDRIGLVTNNVTVNRLNQSKLKAHALTQETINYSVPFVMLQIYSNHMLHYFVDGALVVVVLRSAGKMAKDDLYKHFCSLRSIFALEFVLNEEWYKMHFEDALHKLTEEKIIVLRNRQYDIFENNYFEEVLISSIQPFFLSYYVVTEVLLKLPAIINEKKIFVEVQTLLENAINQKKIFIHPYCLTLDSLGNCLNSLAKLGVLKKSRKENKNVYEIIRIDVAKVKESLEIYISSFRVIKSFEIFLHIKSKL